MRSLIQSWKNKRSGFTRRARWYAERESSYPAECPNIRLCLEDEEGSFNHYPASYDEAVKLWDRFKAGEVNYKGRENEENHET